MAALLTLCASRNMVSSVRLLPMPLAFHCSMLNVLSDMEGVWAVLGDGERGCGGVIQAVHIQPLYFINMNDLYNKTLLHPLNVIILLFIRNKSTNDQLHY